MRTFEFNEFLPFVSLEVETRVGKHVFHVLETEPLHVFCIWVDDRKGRTDLDKPRASFPGLGVTTALNV